MVLTDTVQVPRAHYFCTGMLLPERKVSQTRKSSCVTVRGIPRAPWPLRRDGGGGQGVPLVLSRVASRTLHPQTWTRVPPVYPLDLDQGVPLPPKPGTGGTPAPPRPGPRTGFMTGPVTEPTPPPPPLPRQVQGQDLGQDQ